MALRHFIRLRGGLGVVKNEDGSVKLFNSMLGATVYMSNEHILGGHICDIEIESASAPIKAAPTVVPEFKRRIRLKK